MDIYRDNEFTLSTTLIIPLFPSLRILEIRECPNLKGRWGKKTDIDEKDDIVGSVTKNQNQPFFSCLSDLTIQNCSKLTSSPLFPYAESLHLKNTSFKPLQQTMRMVINNMETTSASAISTTTSVHYVPLSKLQFLLTS